MLTDNDVFGGAVRLPHSDASVRSASWVGRGDRHHTRFHLAPGSAWQGGSVGVYLSRGHRGDAWRTYRHILRAVSHRLARTHARAQIRMRVCRYTHVCTHVHYQWRDNTVFMTSDCGSVGCRNDRMATDKRCLCANSKPIRALISSWLSTSREVEIVCSTIE